MTYPGSILPEEAPSGHGDFLAGVLVAAAGQADGPDVFGVGHRRVHDQDGDIMVLELNVTLTSLSTNSF